MKTFTFGMKGKWIARLDAGGHTTWCSGDTEQQAIKNVLNACRIGSLDDEWFMAFCNRHTDKVTVEEVKG